MVRIAWILLLTLLLLGLPLLGAILSGKALAPYFHFPPVQHLEHAAFSWPVFVVFAAIIALGLAILLAIARRDLRHGRTRLPQGGGDWPGWFWPGLGLLGLSWLLAWTRFDWFAPFQAHTFTPLWLGYIVVVNGLTHRLIGRSLLSHTPGLFAALFPLSALFWWYFEYLNRFVQNWLYLGVQHFTPLEYAMHATLAFSTVLPAVLSTQTLLQAVLRPAPSPLTASLDARRRKRLAVTVLALSALALSMLSIVPNVLFPFLWIVPMTMLLALQGLNTEPRYFYELRTRGWQMVYLPALAALICGVLWELWNVHSAAKWVYSIPFVDRFQLFEMPALGYAGYLPFGIECAVVTLLLSAKPFDLGITNSPDASSAPPPR